MQLPFGKKAAGSASAKANDNAQEQRGSRALSGSGRKDGAERKGSKSRKGKADGRADGKKGSKTGDKRDAKRFGVRKEKPTEPTGVFGAPAQILIPRLVFIFAVVALCVIGLVMIYSSSSIEAYTDSSFSSPHYFFKQQLMWLVIGTIACLAAAFFKPQWYRNIFFVTIIWVVITGLLIAICAGLGTESLGATRSLDLGPIGVQPAEFSKISTVLAVAFLLQKWNDGYISAGMTAALVATVCISTLLFVYEQPDLGTMIFLMAGIFAALSLAGVPSKVLFGLVGVGIAVVAAVCFAQPYHLDRITTVFHPWEDVQGSSYQTVQGFLAFGSGGIFGTGLGLSRQKYNYLPYAYNDFIFAVIGEELGLIGALVVLALFIALFVSGLAISRQARDNHGAVLAGAYTIILGLQAFVNMGCVVGVAPVTGKALPFISYGGSSLLTTMIMCGIIINVSRQSRLDNAVEKRREDLLVYEGGKSYQAQQVAAAAGNGAAARGQRRPHPFGFRDLASSAASLFGAAAGAVGSRGGNAASGYGSGSGSGRGYRNDAYDERYDDLPVDGYQDDVRETSAHSGRRDAKSGGRLSGNVAYGVYGRGSASRHDTMDASSASQSTGSRTRGTGADAGSRRARADRAADDRRAGYRADGASGASRQTPDRKLRKNDLDVELIDIAPRTGRPKRDDARRGANGVERSGARRAARSDSGRSAGGVRNDSRTRSGNGNSSRRSYGDIGSDSNVRGRRGSSSSRRK